MTRAELDVLARHVIWRPLAWKRVARQAACIRCAQPHPVLAITVLEGVTIAILACPTGERAVSIHVTETDAATEALLILLVQKLWDEQAGNEAPV